MYIRLPLILHLKPHLKLASYQGLALKFEALFRLLLVSQLKFFETMELSKSRYRNAVSYLKVYEGVYSKWV